MQHDSNEICAMVFAAGLGTRLYPLTKDRPKALVEIHGKTLLETVIQRIIDSGIRHIVVNIHHFSDLMKEYLASHPFDADIRISDETDFLLDTGGGLKFAEPLFGNARHILLHNVDILSDIDLRAVERQHRAQGNLVTLCVSRRQTKRLLAFDERGLLVGRADEGLAFSGISIVSPELFALLPEADRPYPVIDEYIRLSQAGHRIGAYLHDPAHWLDVGKLETLKQAEQWTVSSVK